MTRPIFSARVRANPQIHTLGLAWSLIQSPISFGAGLPLRCSLKFPDISEPQPARGSPSANHHITSPSILMMPTDRDGRKLILVAWWQRRLPIRSNCRRASKSKELAHDQHRAGQRGRIRAGTYASLSCCSDFLVALPFPATTCMV